MMPKQTHTAALLGLAALLAASLPSPAAPLQTTFQVTSNIPGSCSAATATELAFDAYNGAQKDEASTITVICTTGTTYEIGLNDGLHYSPPNRRMKHGSAAYYLNYELYRDAGRTSRWGSDDAGELHMIGDGAAQAITVYGRIPAGQAGPVGNYTDTITVTVALTD